MNILFLLKTDQYSSYDTHHIYQPLIAKAYENGHVVYVSGFEKYPNVHNFPVPKTDKSFCHRHKTDDSFERYYFYTKQLDEHNIYQDFSVIEKVILNNPIDYIINDGRIAGYMIGRVYQIPVISIEHAAYYQNNKIVPKHMEALNNLLSAYEQEQILRLNEFFDYTNYHIAFGNQDPIFPHLTTYCKLNMDILPTKHKLVGIFTHSSFSNQKLKKIFVEAFSKAPYTVGLQLPNLKTEMIGNLHIENLDYKFANCQVLVHDGSIYLYLLALLFAIPQIVVVDQNYISKQIGQAVEKKRLGIQIPTEQFSMQTLYENYRIIVSNDQFIENAKKQARIFAKEKTLLDVLAILDQQSPVTL